MGPLRSPWGWGVAVFEHIKENNMSFAVGSLVKARGREWVVLPESDEQMLILRPLGGTNEEVTGVYLPLEKVEPAQFLLPDPAQWGDEPGQSHLNKGSGKIGSKTVGRSDGTAERIGSSKSFLIIKGSKGRENQGA